MTDLPNTDPIPVEPITCPPVTKLSVLMPVYNESRTLRTIVDRVLTAPVQMDIELIAVDDGSTDESVAILEKLGAADPRVRVVLQPRNMGKGKAIRTAIEHMTGDFAIIQDADLEYDPEDYPAVLAPLLAGKADAVYGSRFAASEVRAVLPFWHSTGNKILTALSNMANDLSLTDMETCYKALRGDILKQLRLTTDRFGLEPEITARLAQWGARIYEVPISYHGRTYAEGKNIGWRDGVQAIWLIFKFGFLDTRFSAVPELRTRHALGRAPRYRQWMLDQFEGVVTGRVLEVGAGPGHVTSKLISATSLTATDSSPVYAEALRRRVGHLENVDVLVADPNVEGFADIVGRGAYDTVVVFNDLQRAGEPSAVATRAAETLRPGGRLVTAVPADPDLHSTLDRSLGHRRRFTPTGLEETLVAAGLEVEFVRSFDRLGRRLWKMVGGPDRSAVSRMEARLADLAIPVIRAADRRLSGPGMSLVAVARKPE